MAVGTGEELPTKKFKELKITKGKAVYSNKANNRPVAIKWIFEIKVTLIHKKIFCNVTMTDSNPPPPPPPNTNILLRTFTHRWLVTYLRQRWICRGHIWADWTTTWDCSYTWVHSSRPLCSPLHIWWWFCSRQVDYNFLRSRFWSNWYVCICFLTKNEYKI